MLSGRTVLVAKRFGYHCYVGNFPKRRPRSLSISNFASGTTAMTKSDFCLMVLRPIFVLALICALPAGHTVTPPDLWHLLLGACLLSVPLVLWHFSSTHGH
jgi:hypothetical protein